MDKINKTKEEWKKELGPETYHVTREGGTESPFTGKYWNVHDEVVYRCSNCGLELFSSNTKFESGTGWPSFTEPMNRENVELVPDDGAGMHRTEVRCKRCGAHLGHVFDDGPTEFLGRLKHGQETTPRKDKGGKRFCLNSCALNLDKK